MKIDEIRCDKCQKLISRDQRRADRRITVEERFENAMAQHEWDFCSYKCVRKFFAGKPDKKRETPSTT